jgi:hypothetical protein
MEEENNSSDVQARREPHNLSNSTPTRNPGSECVKNDAQVAYGVQIQYSTYVRKAKEMSFSMASAPCHY